MMMLRKVRMNGSKYAWKLVMTHSIMIGMLQLKTLQMNMITAMNTAMAIIMTTLSWNEV